ncbi:MAG: hypothetical protein EBZ78_04140 [Verrucomicrobia bacterium]|nr:hypothetical protein [Verrucomicrobiota bacterium]
MSPHALEKHSLATLARRFVGLASRNTIHRWITEGKLKPEMTDRTAAPYLFRRDKLDKAAATLAAAHDSRVKRLTKTETEFRRIRDKVRRDSLATLELNESAKFSRKPGLCRRERDPALSDADAVGATQLYVEAMPNAHRVINCSINGKPWKGQKK